MKLSRVALTISLAFVASVALAEFKVDPALLLAALTPGAREDALAQAARRAKDPDEVTKQLKEEMDTAVAEWERAVDAVRVAAQRVDAIKLAMEQARDDELRRIAALQAAAAQGGEPQQHSQTTVQQNQTNISPPGSVPAGVYVFGTAPAGAVLVDLRRGEYEGKQFLGLVVPKSYTVVAVGAESNPLPHVRTTSDVPLSWVSWLDFAGRQRGVVFNVFHEHKVVSMSEARRAAQPAPTGVAGDMVSEARGAAEPARSNDSVDISSKSVSLARNKESKSAFFSPTSKK